jgi:hypothetical protein
MPFAALALIDIGAILFFLVLIPVALVNPRHELMPRILAVTAAFLVAGWALSKLAH